MSPGNSKSICVFNILIGYVHLGILSISCSDGASSFPSLLSSVLLLVFLLVLFLFILLLFRSIDVIYLKIGLFSFWRWAGLRFATGFVGDFGLAHAVTHI